VHDALPRTHFLQLATMQPLPLDDADDPLLDELPLPAAQVPALHVPPFAVQSEQDPPPVPQSVSTCDVWQAPVLSQQPPAQLVASQVPPPEPLLELPPSSPLPELLVVLLLLLPLALLPYPLEPAELEEPDAALELLPLDVSEPDELA
jgi:hypothetical protein